MEEYKDILHIFCKINADLALMYEGLHTGVCPQTAKTKEMVEDLEFFKRLLLKKKEELGLKGELSFLEDFSFDTGNPLTKKNAEPVFGIKDGLFFGEKEVAYPVLKQWYESPEEEILKNPYKYEKAVYLLSLVFWGNEEGIMEDSA